MHNNIVCQHCACNVQYKKITYILTSVSRQTSCLLSSVHSNHLCNCKAKEPKVTEKNTTPTTDAITTTIETAETVQAFQVTADWAVERWEMGGEEEEEWR